MGGSGQVAGAALPNSEAGKKHMLYLLNVNWDWIKQRPQYLAEALAEFYIVDAFEKFAYRRGRLIKNPVNSVHLHKLFRLPGERFSLIHGMNDLLYKSKLKSILSNYDYIWIADVSYFKFIKPYISAGQCVIYDSMDDVVEFPQYKNNKALRDQYIKEERSLVSSCHIVFTSASHLKETLLKRYPEVDENKIHVINNAVSDNLLDRYEKYDHSSVIKKSSGRKIITYIGTISQWINWDIILDSLKKFNNIEYHFYGPVELPIPNHERICYKGILPQNKIVDAMLESDLLLMPFKINPLIESVNPVKLYEYILSGVPSLACGYSESEKFSDYVYLYYDEKDFLHFISELSQGKLANKNANGKAFVEMNTWNHRAREIYEIINSVSK